MVDFGLQALTFRQQRPVFWGHFVDEFIKAVPEGCGVDARSRQDFFLDKSVQAGGHPKAMSLDASCHRSTHSI
jgi:hypothetical protein